MKNWIASMLILLGCVLAYQSIASAETTTQEVEVTYSGTGNNVKASDDYVYSDQSTREATFNIAAKTGFIIKNVWWEYLDGELARVAAGDWAGKKSYIGTDTITGTPVQVGTTRSKSFGGIFYWNRSGGSNTWKATMSNGLNVTSSGCSSAPKDSFDLRAYPNCNSISFGEDALSLVLNKDGSYYINSDDGGIKVDDKVVDITTIKPVDIMEDLDIKISNSIYGGTGYADDSTQYIGKYDVLSKTSIRAYFKQTSDGDSLANGYYHDFANPGARQMWWYSALKFKLQATTYRYLDKRLVVEWMPEENEITEIKVRHMVRLGPTGTYTQAAQTTTTLANPLPLSRTITADSSYGTVKGRNVIYSGFSNSIINGSSVKVDLNSSQKTAYVSFFYEKPAPQFTGDFDIVPSVIEYRDSFSFVPKDFQMNGCVYQSHQYKIERNGTYKSTIITGQDNTTTYTYGNYPWLIGVGDHTISIKIKTSCGESDWMGQKTLTVKDMAGNSPPQFQVGFVSPYKRTEPLYKVVEGTTLDLIYIDDPSVPTPTDPDGDTIYFMGFDTDGSGQDFVRAIPSNSQEYTDGYHGIVMDTVGFFSVSAQMRDEFGLTADASTYIQVVPKNPVPVVKCPPFVVSNHPVANNEFDASGSYSPVNRTIDHTRDKWQNKLSSYTNETMSNQIETVLLDVYDSTGLKSLEPGQCSIVVKPDLPPVAKLEVPSVGIRNQPVDVINRSYSPDGDQIVSVKYKYKYDAKNNGFDDDAWQTINGSVLTFSFTPNKVGKYLFYTKVTEDYGKWGDTSGTAESEITLDVVNDSPTISFDLEGKNEQPDLEPMTQYLPDTILSKWKLYGINSTSLMSNKLLKWSPEGNTLSGGTGKLQEDFEQRAIYRDSSSTYQSWSEPFKNFGLGKNNLSPYRAIQSFDAAKTQPLLVEKSGELKPVQFFGHTSFEMLLRSNESHIYFNEPSRESNEAQKRGQRLYALNKSKIGGYKGQSYSTTGWDVHWVHEWLDGSPYDFSFGPQQLSQETPPTFQQYRFRDSTSMYQMDLTNAQLIGTQNYNNFNITGYEVTDKTIYQFVTWQCNGNNCSYYSDNGDRRYSTRWVYDVRAYDALTGELISSTLEKGTFKLTDSGPFYLRSKYDHVLVNVNGNLVELNRFGEIIQTKPNSFSGSSTLGEDAEAWYLMQAISNNSGSKDIYLKKIMKDDLTVTWSTKLSGVMATKEGTLVYEWGDVTAGYPSIIINAQANEVLINTFQQDGFGVKTFFERINMKTGAKSVWDPEVYGPWTSSSTGFEIGWNGAYKKLDYLENRYPATLTADGWKTIFSSDKTVTVKDANGIVNASQNENIILSMNFMYVDFTNIGKYGMYVGDGIYLGFSNSRWGNNADFVPILFVGEPTTGPLVNDVFTLGQFVSDTKLPNADIAFTMSMHQPALNTDLAGMSFRMSDPENRYSIESDGKKVYLSKYVNGVRTVMASNSFIVQAGKSVDFRIHMIGEQIKVYINNIPFFDVTDNEFDDGYFGMFSDKGLVDFTRIGTKTLEEQEQWDTQYAIWNEDEASASIRTDNVIFEDQENDPAAELAWELHHTPRFINNQGLSALDGKTITAGTLTLDNVGDYLIALKGRDDPNSNYLYPDMAFDDYRKDSNEFTQKITVHRRPIADFDVVQQASDGKVIWTDHSLDPDRYESSTVYSTEDTGIDYKATKGIMEKRFYYITPNGTYEPEKLVAPQEVGTYEIGMAVKDEYGAWSNYHVENLTVGKIATPNSPPDPGFTTSKTNTYRGVSVTINSTAKDDEDGDRTHLVHTYYVRNLTTGGAETIKSTSRTSWTISFDQIGTYNIRQVVEDSDGATAQIEHEITIVNRKPVATVTVPSSTNQNSPTKLTVLRPEFTWTYSDPDGDEETKYQVRIYKYGGILQLDSGSQTGNMLQWAANADLPEHTNMYVRVRVYDGYDWGDWSAAKYFYIETNRPPTAGFTWSPTLIFEGDTMTFNHSVADPDRDTLIVNYLITNPNNQMTTYNFNLVYPYSTPEGPSYQAMLPGLYTVKQTVNDGKSPAVTLIKTFTVGQLSIDGVVNHTSQWENNRKAYNQSKTATDNSPWVQSRFLAGEKFMLSADTTDLTGSATYAAQVTATLVETGDVTTLSSLNGLYWTGALWKEEYENLANGTYRFRFRVTYSNGTVKTDDVVITIDQTINDYYSLIREK